MSRTSASLWLVIGSVCCGACDDQRAASLDSGLESAELQTGPVLRLNAAGGGELYACGEGFTAAEVEADQVKAVSSARRACRGAPGGYLCQCDGEPKGSYAFGCVAALFESCGVVAEAVEGSGEPVEPPATCSASTGQCERSGDRYACDCDGALVELEAGAEDTPASCDQALFRACSAGCSDDFGACAPTDSGVLGEYECTCSTNRFTHLARAGSCEEALLWACNPLNQAEEVCTGYGGYCVVTDPERGDELRCTCVGGEAQEVEHVPDAVEPRFRACRQTLEDTCGVGSPPEGALCIAEANGYHARCTRGPDPDAAMTCECYAADDPSDVRIEAIDARTCDEAVLEEVCPQIAD